MLHSSSSQYYACYYALLCLVYYQQQALAVTIVIDGATTNEWATKDEYQRLVDSSQGPLGLGASASGGGRHPQHTKQQHHQHQPPPQHQQAAVVATKLKDGLAPGSNAEREAEEMLKAFNAVSNDKSEDNFRLIVPASRPVSDQPESEEGRTQTGGAARRLFQEAWLSKSLAGQRPEMLSSSSPPATLSTDGNGNQDNSFRNPTSSSAMAVQLSPAPLQNDRNELQLALNRLDLIERERKLQLNQLRQLDSLERAAETGVAAALSHAVDDVKMSGGGGARSLSELVPPTDDDIVDSSMVYVSNFGGYKREAPRKYCGDRLVDIVDIVCNHSFVSSYSPPVISDPVIKSKRSVGYLADNEGDDALPLAGDFEASSNNVGNPFIRTGGRGSTAPVVSRRRKLRTLQQAPSRYEGDGEPSPSPSKLSSSSSSSTSSLSSSPVHDGNIGNTNHNHNHQDEQQQDYLQQGQQQRYLSKSNFINNNDNINNNLSANRQSRRAKLRGIRGLVADCCVRACGWDDLKQYCSKP